MHIEWKKVIVVGVFVIAVIALVVVLISMFKQATQNQAASSASTSTDATAFGGAAPSVQTGTTNTGAFSLQGGGNIPQATSAQGSTTASTQIIFKISDGPVSGAELVNYGIPTTTYSRYVSPEDGHIYEQKLDSAGSLSKMISNITIPGVSRAVWTDGGNGVLLQYMQGGTIKTVHLLFAATSATTTISTPVTPPVVRFLPDGVTGIAASPNSKNIAYTLRTSAGSDVYTASSDGSNAAKLFSLPLSELKISWSATTTLFLYTKAAGGVQGISFSANTKTGAVTPVLYGVGMTATADPFYTSILYRTDTGSGATLYAEQISSGQSAAFNIGASLAAPLPETCVWNPVRPLQAFCAAPSVSAPDNYLELWHRGESSVASAIISVNVFNGTIGLIATPGTRDGGETSDAYMFAISPNARYLSFVSKDDQKLWGVRLVR